MVLRRRDLKAEVSFNIATLLNRLPVKGDVGIEIEVEGKKLPREDVTPPPWVYKIDHSLRGQENAEYVLHRPIAFDDVEKELNRLWDVFRAKGSTIDESNRTSVHIHLNCQTFHLNRLASLIALYMALEEPLTAFCGDHRVGKRFCLRTKDAPAIASHIKKFISSDGKTGLPDGLHYSGMNAGALAKFGSLEFRTLRGVSDPAVINDWVSILRRLYELSAEFPDPRAICEAFSADGPSAFFDSVLGDRAGLIRAASGMNEAELRESMYGGIRAAQDICYCRDWTLFNGVEIRPDPFGRDAKKLFRKLHGAAEPVADLGAMTLEELEDLIDEQGILTHPAPPPQAVQGNPFTQWTIQNTPPATEGAEFLDF